MKQAILTYNGVNVDDIESCTVIRENDEVTIQFNKKKIKTRKSNYILRRSIFLGTLTAVGVMTAVGVYSGITSTENDVTDLGLEEHGTYVAKFETTGVHDIEVEVKDNPVSYYKSANIMTCNLKSNDSTDNDVLEIPTDVDTSFKAYMDYRTITNTESKQYKMQQNAWTGLDGVRRIGDDICVALGTYYTDGCGERFEITLDTGKSFTAIVSDIKDDKDTDDTNRYTLHDNGERACVVEFIVDVDEIGSKASSLGDISCNNFKGEIESIVKL